MRWLVVAALAACGNGGEPRPPPAPASPARTAAVDAAPADTAPPDGAIAATAEAAPAPACPAALAAIERRVAQSSPKMKLTADQGRLAADRLRAAVAAQPELAALCAVMPESAVELVRAVHERGVDPGEAGRIARYLVRLVDIMRFERLDRFDRNHSHVIGREWAEIDYTGEAMTWQSQRAYWAPRGVPSYRTAAAIHAYFTGAERLPHFGKVYRPRGRMAEVPPP